jgi:hypothetical protein
MAYEVDPTWVPVISGAAASRKLRAKPITLSPRTGLYPGVAAGPAFPAPPVSGMASVP